MKPLEEAKNCHDCLSWHKHCHAECCRTITLETLQVRRRQKGEVLIINAGELSTDMTKYYALHGFKITQSPVGSLIEIKLGVFQQRGRFITIYQKCALLQEDNTCSGYPDQRPAICHRVNADDLEPEGVTVTKNCLYHYKKLLTEKAFVREKRT